MIDNGSRNATADPDDDDLRELFRSARPRITAIFRVYGIDETHALDILSALWVLMGYSEANRQERFRQLIDAAETACRELRAELGPEEEEEHERYVH